ncbi:MAG: T9SS type A sorting domain-containing protein, partial [Bacteroidales bacterium]
IGGKWYIYYKGSYPWSHFEAPAAKSISAAASANIEIYPNPFSDAVNIKLNAQRLSKVEVYSSMGQLLDVISGDRVLADNIRLKLDYPGNVFVLKLHTESGVINRMVLKK